MSNVRTGEYHEDEVIEAASDSFARCHFYNCEIVGISAKFIDCVFGGGSVSMSLDGDFTNCLFAGNDILRDISG